LISIESNYQPFFLIAKLFTAQTKALTELSTIVSSVVISIFVKGTKRRTRFGCKEISTGKTYLFHQNAEVDLIEN